MNTDSKNKLIDNYTMQMNKSYILKNNWDFYYNFFTSLNCHVYVPLNESTDIGERREEKDLSLYFFTQTVL